MRNPSSHITLQVSPDTEPPVLSYDACARLLERIVALSSGGGDTVITVDSRTVGSTRWARNRMRTAAELRTMTVQIRRTIHGRDADVVTNRTDTEGLRDAVQQAEQVLAWHVGRGRPAFPVDDAPLLRPVLWSEQTMTPDAEARASIARRMVEQAVATDAASAGVFTLTARGRGLFGTTGLARYYATTSVDCAMTARNLAQRASGWAGQSHYDLAQVDPHTVARTALAKCAQSANPVAIEPGRYTVILEPQAVHDLFAPVIEQAVDRGTAEGGYGPFAGGWAESASKIGTQVIDDRLMLSADPMDPDAGFLPFDERSGSPHRAVTWIDRGYLRELAYPREYAVQQLGYERALPNSASFRLQAAPGVRVVPVDDMIASTERGVLVSRFSSVNRIDFKSMLCTGYTRDGVWLIERGKIVKPIVNFRFTESPIHILNRVDAIGAAVRAYAPEHARMVPALKVKDFNFSSLADAI